MHKSFKELLMNGWARLYAYGVWIALSWLAMNAELQAQCTPVAGQISGRVFYDVNYSGALDAEDVGIPNIEVQVYNGVGSIVATTVTDDNGNYAVSGLNDGEYYRVEFVVPEGLRATHSQQRQHRQVRRVRVPSCDIHFGLIDGEIWVGTNTPPLVVTRFIRGGENEYADEAVLLRVPSDFEFTDPATGLATKAQLGAVRSMAWSRTRQQLYIAAFVKQGAALKDGMYDAIYTKNTDGSGSVVRWVRLSDLGISVLPLTMTDPEACDYGAMVGRYGISEIALSEDETRLFVVSLWRKSLVSIDVESPSPSTTEEFFIPDPTCTGGEYYPFALKQWRGKLYVGVTCSAEHTKDRANHSIVVYSFDPQSGMFDEVLRTDFTRDYWTDQANREGPTQHWLTDIDFTAEGYMILGIADRLGHSYCHPDKLLKQNGDILIAAPQDDGSWTLESNGKVGPYTGSGVHNNQGPGGGEFFGEDYWRLGPTYHPEVSVGAVRVLTPKAEVVNAVFDPFYSTFTGGLHRYSAINGAYLASAQLHGKGHAYFGKSSGLGDIELLLPDVDLEIGDYVWHDADADGVQDPDEEPLANIEVRLYDDQCSLIGTTTTNAYGYYSFGNHNVDTDGDGVWDGLAHHTEYYVVVAPDQWDASLGRYQINGKEYKPTRAYAGSGVNAGEHDSDLKIYDDTEICPLLAGMPVIRVRTGGFAAHRFGADAGLTERQYTPPSSDVFDLALIKQGPKVPVRMGDTIAFEITIVNQGTVTAHEVEVVDYLPTHNYDFIPALNPGWFQSGGVFKKRIMTPIAPSDTVRISLYVSIKADIDLGSLVNIAEISGAWDEMGQPLTDVDSKYDTDPANDSGGQVGTATDDIWDGNGIIDEDDHDPATVAIVDLALRKTCLNTAPVRMGDQVTYLIEVINQGNQAISGYKIVDYLTEGYTFDPAENPGWTVDSFLWYLDTPPHLPGDTLRVYLYLRANANLTPENAVNRAEIARIMGPKGEDWSTFDFDSQADEDPDNDKGGQIGDITDDMVDDHNVIDEDDHDPAVVPFVDLALVKSDAAPLELVNNRFRVRFTLRLINQGNVPITKARVVDYLPSGTYYVDSINTHPWIELSAGKYALDIEGRIEPGGEVEFGIVLEVDEAQQNQLLYNRAEVFYLEMEGGQPVLDYDAEGDLDPLNDPVIDDEVLRRDGTDEDDHDVGEVIWNWFDLALRKYTDDTLKQRGDTVRFYITIYNQGRIAADNIKIVDYFPWYFHYAGGYGWEYDTVSQHWMRTLTVANGSLPAGGLQPGDSVTISIDLRIDDNARSGMLVNFAEIADATDAQGDPVEDIDSTPDANPDNDAGGEPGGGTDNLIDALPGMDEDDHDPAFVFIIEIDVVTTCLNNATTATDGQFLEEITILSPQGLDWCFVSATNLYSNTSPAPPAAPIPLTTCTGADKPVEILLDPTTSVFQLQVRSIDGQPWSIVFQNKYGNRLTLHQPPRYYDAPPIYGLNSACENSTTSFHTDPLPGATYQWTVSGGATIVGPSDQPNVDIMWPAMGTYTLTLDVDHPSVCYEPATLTVTVGNQPAQAVSCKSEVQFSLDSLGKAVITPEMLLVGSGYDYNSFGVMLMDMHGQPLPGNMLTCEYLGQKVMAKVVNSCSGNSCWSTITVEDKLPPVIECFNDTMTCVVFRNYIGPRVYDNCDDNPTIVLLDERIEPMCHDTFLKKVTRKYVAVDHSGNVSDTCTQMIFLERIRFDSIVFPDSMTVALGNPLLCDAVQRDAQGRISTDQTGVPTYNGEPMYPSFPFYCNIQVGFKDEEFPPVGCVRKILRQWFVVEQHCDSFVLRRTYFQPIEITDTTAPVVQCPDDVTVPTLGFDSCIGRVTIPLPQVSDNCSDIVRISVVYPGGYIENLTGPVTVSLPRGIHTVKYRVYDACYNVDSCTFQVTVEDRVPPVPVCITNTVVGLVDSAPKRIPAETFDQGSYDDCGIARFLVRRMDGGSPCGAVVDTFAPYVEFCCADVGTTVQVVLRVVDSAGNTNDCMVNVEVQDKQPPVVICPPCIRVPCTYKFEIDSLGKYFGRVVADSTQRRKYTLYGPDAYVLDRCGGQTPAGNMFFDGYVRENCGIRNIAYTYSDFRNSCGVGSIIRGIAAVDFSGNIHTCFQTIEFYNPAPFGPDQIIWPQDYTAYTCDSLALVPENLPPGYDTPAIVRENECNLVGVAYKDEIFRFIPGSNACYKILRTWTVIDWCQSTNTLAKWEHQQVIKVIDTVPPVIENCRDTSICTYDETCRGGYLEMRVRATDQCTNGSDLHWEVHIDLNNDGVYDQIRTGAGQEAVVADSFPIGKHRALWQFEDRCGNKRVCTNFFEIKNCKAPLAYCKDIVVSLVPMDRNGDGICDIEMVDVWAKDVDDNSSHPCGYPLVYSWGRDTTRKFLRFRCGEEGIHRDTMCVTDINGNQSCCVVNIIVQDNNDQFCCPFNRPCIDFPPDWLIYDCTESLDTSIRGVPSTANCLVDSATFDFVDVIDPAAQDPYRCRVVSRIWSVTLYALGQDSTIVDTQYLVIDNRFNADSIIWPDALVELRGCNPNTDPSVTGTVQLRGEYCGYVTTSYTDRDSTDPADACRYILRTWKVTNACENNEMFSFTQTIRLLNAGPPVLTGPNDTTVNAEVDSCSAFVALGEVRAMDCSSGVRIENDYNNGGADASDRYPVGKTTVTFTATDSCGNTSTWSVMITVRDLQPPTVQCPADITLACNDTLFPLSRHGALTAMDNCHIQSITIDSVVDLNLCNVGTITRRIVAVDSAGNSAQCTQRITVVIPHPITEADITWPADTTLPACSSTQPSNTGEPMVDTSRAECFRIAVSYTDSMYQSLCGADTCTVIERRWTVIDSCQYDGTQGIWRDTQRIEVLNPMLQITCPPDTTITCDQPLYPLSQFGSATYSSECGVGSTYVDSVVNVNKCTVGTVMRIFYVQDTVGNIASCTQTIRIVIDSPIGLAQIQWPQDSVISDSCVVLDTAYGGSPVVDTTKASCYEVYISYRDSAVNEAPYCQLIHRRWTVIDSCQADGSGAGVFEFTQVLGILDTVAPTIVPTTLDTTVYVPADTCIAKVTGLSATAMDKCPVDTLYHNSPYDTTGGVSADGNYPLGTHTFYYYASDSCGNTDSVAITVRVLDTVPPMPVCRKILRVLPDDGKIFIKADTLLEYLSDNCTDSVNIMVSYDKNDFTDTVREYNCDSLLPDKKKIFSIKVYAKDESGNIDSCIGQFELHDQNNVCQTNLVVGVHGTVQLENGKPVPQTMIRLYGGDNASSLTDEQGYYAFYDLPLGEEYVLNAQRKGNYLNGVTTADIIRIHNHLLGRKMFESPYQYLAADANNSGYVSIGDVAMLRALILGKIRTLNRHKSPWRFIPADLQFDNPRNPFATPIDEEVRIQLQSPHKRQDFIAVKIGDVTGDVRVNNVQQSTTRNKPIALHADIKRTEDGHYLVRLYLAEPSVPLKGLQFELYHPGGFDNAVIEGGDEHLIREENWNVVDRQFLRLSWNAERSDQRLRDVLYLRLPFRQATEVQQWLDELQIGYHIRSEVYTETTEQPIELKKTQDNSSPHFVLYPNKPNPFTLQTTIGFYLAQQGKITLQILDVSGKELYRYEGLYDRGYHQITVGAEKFKRGGLYYYRLFTPWGAAIQKMIFLQ